MTTDERNNLDNLIEEIGESILSIGGKLFAEGARARTFASIASKVGVRSDFLADADRFGRDADLVMTSLSILAAHAQTLRFSLYQQPLSGSEEENRDTGFSF